MGLLTEGTPLSWDEIVAARDILRSYALAQLVRIFEKCKDRQRDCFMWGDEVCRIIESSLLNFLYFQLEFCLVRFDQPEKRVQLLLKAHEILPRLFELNENIPEG
jgi:hypothetical protein